MDVTSLQSSPTAHSVSVIDRVPQDQIRSPKGFQSPARIIPSRRIAEFLAQAPKNKFLGNITEALKASGKAEEFNRLNQKLESAMHSLLAGKAVDKAVMAEDMSRILAIVNSNPDAKESINRYLNSFSKLMGLSSKGSEQLIKRLDSPLSTESLEKGLDGATAFFRANARNIAAAI